MSILVAYTDSWRIKEDFKGHSPGFEAVGYDDSSWVVAPGNFGESSQCGYVVSTLWNVNTDLTLRKHITVPANTTSLSILYGVDNEAWLYWNGAYIYSSGWGGCAGPANQAFNIPTWNVGDNVLSVRARDNGSIAYFALQLSRPEEATQNALFGDEGRQTDGTRQATVIRAERDMRLNAGDSIYAKAQVDNAASFGIIGSETYTSTYFSIEKLASLPAA